MPDYRRVRVPGGNYFLTLVTYRRAPLFLMPNLRRVLLESMVWLRHKRMFRLDAAVVLPDHLHLLITLPSGDSDYSTRVMLLKKRFSLSAKSMSILPFHPASSRALSRGESGFWQRRFWEHTIRNESDFRNHLDYMMFNPVKHGFSKRAADWPFSSFHRLVEEGFYDRSWGGLTDGIPEAQFNAGE